MTPVFASMCRLVKSCLITGIVALVIADFVGYGYAPSAGGWGTGLPVLTLADQQVVAAIATPVAQTTTLLTSMQQVMGSEQF